MDTNNMKKASVSEDKKVEKKKASTTKEKKTTWPPHKGSIFSNPNKGGK